MRVAVIGLGAMGAPMAQVLAGSGFSVTGCDPDPARRAAFQNAVPDAAKLAGVDAALLSLPDDAAVRGVWSALRDALSPGGLVIDASTVAPQTCRALQAEAAARGIGWVDAPVSGGPAGAADGALLAMVGGADPDVERAMPVLDALTRKVARCGGPGAGAVVKLANNLLCAGHLLLAGEALRLAEAGGVAPEALLEAVNAGSGRSAVTEVNLPRWILSDAFDSGFTLGLMAKDVTLAAALPGAGPRAAQTAADWAAARDALGADADFNRIVGRP
jgi:3-hydroxyisobutyrate dehydrogenase